MPTPSRASSRRTDRRRELQRWSTLPPVTRRAIHLGIRAPKVRDLLQVFVVDRGEHGGHLACDLLGRFFVRVPLARDVAMGAVHAECDSEAELHDPEEAPGGDGLVRLDV